MFAAELPPEHDDPLGPLMTQLRQRQWGVLDGWLPDDALRALRADLLRLRLAARFRPAGVGRGASFRLAPEIRSDFVHWMDPAALSPPQQALWAAFEQLRVRLNRTFFLGLRRFEGHLTVYPQGAHYQKHVDQFADAVHRRVSCILYLNRVWSLADGGALRVYDPLATDTPVADLPPLWGRMVVFFSDTVPHEVLTTHRHRLSATGWFRDDDAPL
ncbi:MAG: 2OG-Fe(II) oxygenase [Myxococcales bacterium]|nr:2OG-Fe(II) oxygenase [Myxococcales bacterium]